MVKPLLIAILLTGLAPSVSAQSWTMEQILQKVIKHYPSLKIASMQVEKAAKETIRVDSQLGWQLSGQSGIAHDVSLLGTPFDQLMIGGGAAKKLDSGDILSLSGSIRYEDYEEPMTPPNPSTHLDLEINYRKSLAKGAGNADYQLAATQALAGSKMARSQARSQYDQMASQVLALYLQAVIIQRQIANVKTSIRHSRRLDKFVKSRLEFGISQSKDQLQVTAQLNGLDAKLKGLNLLWIQQQITLNRLMGLPWDNKIRINLTASSPLQNGDLQGLIDESILHSPELMVIDSELTIADALIKNKSNNRKDTLDLVGYVGNKRTSGSGLTNSEPTIGIRLEYQGSADQSGYDAELSQAYLDRSIALQKQADLRDQIHYQIASLLAEIKWSRSAHSAARLSVQSEQAKLTEAEERYRKGRIEVDQLIQFEAQLTESKLALALQQVELERRQYQLTLLRGAIWKKIELPQYDWSHVERPMGDAK